MITETQPVAVAASDESQIADGKNGHNPTTTDASAAERSRNPTPPVHTEPAGDPREKWLGVALIVLALIAAFGIAVPVSYLAGLTVTEVAPATVVPLAAWILLAVVLVAVAVTLLRSGIAIVGGAGKDSPSDEGIGTSLLGSALIALSVGAIVMSALWRLRDDIFVGRSAGAAVADPSRPWPWMNEFAVVAGILATIITVFVYRTLSAGNSAPNRANPWQYGELRARRDYLEASYQGFCAGMPPTASARAACTEACHHIREIGVELGLIDPDSTNPCGDSATGSGRRRSGGDTGKWILGTGFVEMWQRLHAAEAALFGRRPLAQQLSYAQQDVSRLSGCELEADVALKLRLQEAIETLKNSAAKEATVTMTPEQATEILITTHKAIDDYRDKSRAGLARTRVHLICAGIMTAVVAYVLLALAIIDDVEPYQMVAGGAFFLVGAAAGLVSQLRYSGSTIRSGEDDFGLDHARLVYVPVLSGLAGVGGVLLMAMLYPTLNVVLDLDTPERTLREIPNFSDIFDLNANRFGLVVAAVFGLTPDLLINRLQGQADQYRTQLAATSPQTRSSEPVYTELIGQLRSVVKDELNGSTNASSSAASTAPKSGISDTSGTAAPDTQGSSVTADSTGSGSTGGSGGGVDSGTVGGSGARG